SSAHRSWRLLNRAATHNTTISIAHNEAKSETARYPISFFHAVVAVGVVVAIKFEQIRT
ncbi:unnamed protein product, partial [Brassica rapa subsp. narinosa]